MLLLDGKSLSIEGVTVFRDSADPAQFWYLPGPVALARRPADGRKAFTFMAYKRGAGAASRGGGFLMLEVDLALDAELERRIVERLRAHARGEPRLAPVLFDDGTVQCIALNLQGAGGTRVDPATGGFVAVETILGAARPSLAGANEAAFSLQLSAEGTTLLRKAFVERGTPIGVLYDLKYTGLRPALAVRITADFAQVFTHFSAGGDAQRGFVRAGIDAGFESLTRSGAIRIEVTDMTGSAENEARIKEALDSFKQQVLATWFTPVLTPGTLAAGGAAAARLEEVRTLGAQMKPPQPAAPARPDPAAPPPAAPADPSPTEGTGKPEKPAALAAAAGGGVADASPTAGTGMIATSAVPPRTEPSRIAAATTPAATTSAGTAEPAADGMVAAFRLKTIRQEERRTVTFDYSRSEAQQRSYAPQGFVGLIAAGLDRPPYFIEVDLDDPFFRTITVEARTPFDYARIGLSQVDLALDYGPADDAANHRHHDMVFGPEDRGPKTAEFALNLRRDERYRYGAQFHFDPASGWEGEHFSYDLSVMDTVDRTLIVNPEEALGFMDIAIEPGRIDPEVVAGIGIALSYTDPTGWSCARTLDIVPGGAVQHWKLRVSPASPRRYTHVVTYRMKDGSQRVAPAVETAATRIAVDDPLPGALRLTFFPAIDFATLRAAFVDIRYSDPANHYERDARLRLTATDSEATLQLSIMNPALREYRYQCILVRQDGTVERQAPVTTTDDIVTVVA